MSGDPVGPVVGLTLPFPAADPHTQRKARRAAAAYRRAVEFHGAVVVELPANGPTHSLDDLDGLLLSGGGDVHPSHYGEPPHPKLGSVDAARDRMELRLARAALSSRVPVMGICRGAQVLGVALGGGLIQDIASEVEEAQQHASEAARGGVRHWVNIARDSRLGRVLRADRARVNSSHHQANGRLGRGVRSVAWSGDGVVEGIERDGPHFAVGVQWHPERMWRRAPRQRRLFAAFVAAAGDYAVSRSQH
jgi:putative glutamine amidotransferase